MAKGDRSTSPLGIGQQVLPNLHDREAAILSNLFHLEIENQRKKGVRSPTLHNSLLRKSSLPEKAGMSNLVGPMVEGLIKVDSQAEEGDRKSVV